MTHGISNQRIVYTPSDNTESGYIYDFPFQLIEQADQKRVRKKSAIIPKDPIRQDAKHRYGLVLEQNDIHQFSKTCSPPPVSCSSETTLQAQEVIPYYFHVDFKHLCELVSFQNVSLQFFRYAGHLQNYMVCYFCS